MTISLLLSFIPLISLSTTLDSDRTFRFPTPNHTLLVGGGSHYFVGTQGRTWESGAFGCVRSEGTQFHEGLDIRCTQRDRNGEPIDPVFATADGRIAYINRRSSKSNYGQYVVIRHRVENFEIYSVYAHLSKIKAHLRQGTSVRAGSRIGTMGRTSNTRQRISKARAHLHFEIALLANPDFESWYRKIYPGSKNDHGRYNGRNLIGLDPEALFREQARLGAKFSIRDYILNRDELFQMIVPATQFQWSLSYPALVVRSTDERPPPNAFKVSFDFSGLPFRMEPIRLAERPTRSRSKIVSVSADELEDCSCRGIIRKSGRSWRLSARGERHIDLLTHRK